MSRYPEVKWAQRSDKIYITVELPDANNPKVKVEPEGKFSFSARVGKDQALYEVDLDLLDRVNVKESRINVGLRNIVCIIEKEEKKWWKQLAKTEGKRLPFLKVDWNKWVDEDEENGEGKDMDPNQMDFSKLGMGDDDLDFDELEDEEEIGNENQSADEKAGVSFRSWVDEDEENGEGKDMDLNQMDFSKLGMGDDDLDFDELEDEEEIGNENQSADEKAGQEPHIEDSGKGKAIET